jgi:polyketide biosynthesis enoyl-CoA hydratase PksI
MDLPVPVVAACRGHAIGGGLALALSCDLVFLAEESRYGANFIDLGITPGMGMTHLLEHFVGPAVAHELLYTGEPRRGRDLAHAGHGFNGVSPALEVEERAIDTALRIADKRVESTRLLKRALTLPRRRAFEESHTLETLMHETTLGGLDLGRMLGDHETPSEGGTR